MAVKIRMKRMGRRHRAYFRLQAVDSRTPRDGRSIEELGRYDPLEKSADKQIVLNRDRITYWLSVGAQPSPTVASMLEAQGFQFGTRARKLKKKKKSDSTAK